MTIRLREFKVAEEIGQARALLEEHWRELATNPELMVLNPAVERYTATEQEGRLLAIGAFDDGRMVGYSVNIIAAHLHYADLMCAHNDVLFVSKDHRTGRTGMRLIAETERAARRRGARLMFWHSKPDTALQDILPRVGYRVQDIVFSKEL